MHYELSGPEGAPAVALSSSLGTDLRMWDPQIDALSSLFRVVRYDMRGHGSSPAPSGPYTIADLGGDLLAIIDEAGVERLSLCGLSIGGMVSIWIAAHAPDRVERLVLCCTSAWLAPEAARAYLERAATVRSGGVAAVADVVLGRWLTPPFSATHPDVVASLRAMLTGTSAEGYAGCCEALAAMDLRPELHAITAPTLVIAAEHDPALPPEHGQAIAAGIAGAELTVAPRAAHLATVERPDYLTLILKGLTSR